MINIRRLQWRLGRRLYSDARGEPRINLPEVNGEVALIKAVIAATVDLPCLTILDIGANQGDWSLPLLSALPDDRLQSGRLNLCLFEPVPQTSARLTAAINAARGGTMARIENYALSDTPGFARMAVMSDTGGTNTLTIDNAVAKSALRMIDIEKITLSTFAAKRGFNQLNLVKCDTEGHDYAVIKGAEALFKAQKIDVFQFEYNHRWITARAFLKDVFDLIEGQPYKIARVQPNGIEVFEGWHHELERFFEANYVIVREPALAWFKTRYGKFDAANSYG